MDTASSVSASLDMLRATRTAARELGRPLTGDVYGTGFSQGGQVAMALGRALSQGDDAHFRLKVLAPVSGPYDLEGQEMPALLDGRVNDTSGVLYMAYWLTAQNRLHPSTPTPPRSSARRTPVSSTASSTAATPPRRVLAALPGTVKDMLTPEFYASLTAPQGPLLDAMRVNDHSCDWKPDVPVRLYTATGDTDVPIGNTLSCARQLRRTRQEGPGDRPGSGRPRRGLQEVGAAIVRLFDSVAGRPSTSCGLPVRSRRRTGCRSARSCSSGPT